MLEKLSSDRIKVTQRVIPNKFTILFGELVHRARIEKKLSQSELAENSDLSRAAVSQIRKGKKIC